jgi:hypothetical protein
MSPICWWRQNGIQLRMDPGSHESVMLKRNRSFRSLHHGTLTSVGCLATCGHFRCQRKSVFRFGGSMCELELGEFSP